MIKNAEIGLRIALVNCENLVRLGNRLTAAAQLGAAVQQGRLSLEQFSEANISLKGAPWLVDEGTPPRRLIAAERLNLAKTLTKAEKIVNRTLTIND